MEICPLTEARTLVQIKVRIVDDIMTDEQRQSVETIEVQQAQSFAYSNLFWNAGSTLNGSEDEHSCQVVLRTCFNKLNTDKYTINAKETEVFWMLVSHSTSTTSALTVTLARYVNSDLVCSVHCLDDTGVIGPYGPQEPCLEIMHVQEMADTANVCMYKNN